MPWYIYALLSALFAALVAIFGKLGLKDIDSTLATTIRSIIMAVFLFGLSLLLGKFNGFNLTSFNNKEWILIALAGICGALSWLFYFVGLKYGPASSVAALDRLSIVFVVVLATIFLAETFTYKTAIGTIFIIIGAIMLSLK